ncbi:2-phosphosulfolactate phosphatase [Porphyromonas gingivalis]|uniref:2-phosphosulfolactate phosphatase n=1 Tax=Porphyromonas gingivalis TaxID=837 RepID=UPI0003AD11E1|nr:2-phosphosulfolactate phosphatase [Porphyromonas gingivalis]ATR90633.1 2-phosphosulfolactate phosphatase [Porphyromonas gingivalis]ERJ85732.1 2-phosphosulfolactate phosphatase [Porphyromonas gingivalis F0566]PDP78080.1 2-phosphosulfolactate phosphatase [Porphyromonas gingivalis]
MLQISLCPSPVLYPYYKTEQEEYTVVIVDIFRAGTTITTALMNGAVGIIPIATVEEAEIYAGKGFLVGGERGTKRLPFAHFGNAPEEYTRQAVEGKQLVLSTTNGTRAADIAAGALHVIIGAFINLEAVARYCIAKQKPIMVLASGWQNRMSTEDCLFAGALAATIVRLGEEVICEDGASVFQELWGNYNTHEKLTAYLNGRDHYERLRANKLERSVPYCTSLNLTEIVPELTFKISAASTDCPANRLFLPVTPPF